jgi:hypothetical protein
VSSLIEADAHFHGAELVAYSSMYDASTRGVDDLHRNPVYQQALLGRQDALAVDHADVPSGQVNPG